MPIKWGRKTLKAQQLEAEVRNVATEAGLY